MAEWAILDDNGSVKTILTSNGKPLMELWPGTKLVPLDEVPEQALQNYEYWSTRP